MSSITYSKRHEDIVQSGIEAISKVLLGHDMSEKESLLFCLDKFLDPFFGYNLFYKDDIILLVQQVIVDNNSKGCKEEAIHLLAAYTCPPFKVLSENLDKIEPEFLSDIKNIIRREFILDGKKFDDLECFYCEIDNLFTKNLNWKTGHNLAAFNDLLRGGFGVHEYSEPIKIIWINFQKSKKDLGYNALVKYYEQILPQCHPTGVEQTKKRLKDAKCRKGETLSDIIIEIIQDSDNTGHDCVLETID